MRSRLPEIGRNHLKLVEAKHGHKQHGQSCRLPHTLVSAFRVDHRQPTIVRFDGKRHRPRCLSAPFTTHSAPTGCARSSSWTPSEGGPGRRGCQETRCDSVFLGPHRSPPVQRRATCCGIEWGCGGHQLLFLPSDGKSQGVRGHDLLRLDVAQTSPSGVEKRPILAETDRTKNAERGPNLAATGPNLPETQESPNIANGSLRCCARSARTQLRQRTSPVFARGPERTRSEGRR